MRLEIIPLALKKIRRRKIPIEWIEETVSNPNQVVEGYRGRRVVLEDNDTVVTAYLTSQVSRYWRDEYGIEYDPKYDIMNIEFIAEGDIAESVELEDGIIVDYGEDKKVVSIEILDVKKRVSERKLEGVSFVILK